MIFYLFGYIHFLLKQRKTADFQDVQVSVSSAPVRERITIFHVSFLSLLRTRGKTD